MKHRKKQDVSTIIRQKYYNPKHPGSYGGIHKFHKSLPELNVKQKDVKEWLKTQDTYTLHAPVQRHFKRRRVIVHGIDHQWQADLVDLRSMSKHNDGFKY